MVKIRALPVFGAAVLVFTAWTANPPASAGTAQTLASANLASTIATWSPGVPPPALPAAANGANLAPTPPMGWNDWAHYGCAASNPYTGDVGPSESLFHTVADNLKNSGLAADGYQTVTVDDCWMTPTRDANGNMVTNTTNFPDGMAALGTYFHNDGLKYGIYNDAGSATCTGQAGSAGHYTADANLFASFGVDYVKTDGCNVSGNPPSLSTYESDYTAMSQALAASGRPMAFSESEPAYFYINQSNVSNWYTSLASSQTTGQLWREGNDTAMWNPSGTAGWGWGYVMTNFNYNWPLARYSEPDSWNDPDFLLTGDNTLTVDQQKSQFALWSIMAAPLIVSSNASALLDPTTQSILGNTSIIAIDQDRLGAAATVASSSPNGEDVLARPLANGDRALAIFNDSGSSQTLSATLGQIGYTTQPNCSYTVTDLWTGNHTTATATTQISATLNPDATEIYRVSSPFGCGTTIPSSTIVGPINSQAGCISVANSNPGTAAVPAACNGTAAERFSLAGNGTISNGSSCLAATGSSGAAVQLATCSTGTNTQQWSYTTTGNLVNTSNNLCLDVYGGVGGTWLDTWACGSAQANQIFQLPVSQATGEVHVLTTSANDGTCLATQNGALTAGAQVVSATCDGSADQNWTAPGDGTLRLNGLCLDDYYSEGVGTQQELWGCSGGANQAWTYDTLGNLTNNHNNLCLSVTGDSTTSGTAVELNTCNTTPETGQLWTLPQ